MGTVKNVVALIAVEVFAVFLLYMVMKYVFDFDIFDFSSTRGKLIGFAITGVFLYSFYTVLFEPGELQNIGSAAEYNRSDARRLTATSQLRPQLF